MRRRGHHRHRGRGGRPGRRRRGGRPGHRAVRDRPGPGPARTRRRTSRTGGCRPDRTSVVLTDDGIPLGGRGGRPGRRAADRRVRARAGARPRLLALPVARPGRHDPPAAADGLLRPALARAVRPGAGRDRDDRPARRRPLPGAGRGGADRAGGAGRPLDGRHGRDVAGRPAPGAVRAAGDRGGADLHLDRPAVRGQLRAAGGDRQAARPGACRWCCGRCGPGPG